MSFLLFSNCIFQLNHLVHENALPQYTVFRVKKLVCNKMANQVQLANCNLIKGYSRASVSPLCSTWKCCRRETWKARRLATQSPLDLMARLVFFFDFELVASLNGQVPLQALKQGGDGKDEGMQHIGMSIGVVLLLLALSMAAYLAV